MSDINNPPTSIDNEQLVSLFHHASRLMARVYHKGDHAHHAQGRVLSIIRERGPIKQKDLLTLLDVRSSSLSEVLAKLEGNDLIVRRRDEEDKRGFVVSAKEGNQSTLPTSPDGYQKSADTLFAVLSDQERNQLGELFTKVIGALEDQAPCEGKSQKMNRHHKHHHPRLKRKRHGRKFNHHGHR